MRVFGKFSHKPMVGFMAFNSLRHLKQFPNMKRYTTFRSFSESQIFEISKKIERIKEQQETDDAYSKSLSSGNQVDGLPLVLSTELLLS